MQSQIISVKFTPTTPLPLQGMGEIGPGAWRHNISLLPPPSTLLGALAAPHLQEASGNTREKRLKKALKHIGIGFEAARAVYALINGIILLPSRTSFIPLNQVANRREEKVLGKTPVYESLSQKRTHVKLLARAEQPNKLVDEDIGGLYQRKRLSHLQPVPQSKTLSNIEIYLDIKVKQADLHRVREIRGITRLPRTPVSYEVVDRSPLLQFLQEKWRYGKKALLLVATPILTRPTNKDLLALFKDDLIKKATGLDIRGPYPVIKDEKPEIQPLFPGFDQGMRRREPLYTALMPGAAYVAENIDDWEKLYLAEMGEKTFLGYGVIIPVPIR